MRAALLTARSLPARSLAAAGLVAAGLVATGLVAAGLVAAVLAAPSAASAQDGPTRVLFISGGSVPVHVRRTVVGLFASRGVLASYETYSQAAEAAHLRPSSPEAIRTIGSQQGATVIVVAGYGGHYRRRMLRLRFYSGTTGELVSSASYAMAGQALRPASQHAILRDLDAAAGGGGGAPPPPEGTDEGGGSDDGGGGGGGGGGLPPPMDWGAEGAEGGEGGEGAEGAEGGEPEGTGDATPEGGEGEGEPEVPLEQQSQWGFSIDAGVGIMQRSSSIPLASGDARLSTTPFPAILAEVMGSVRPDPSSRYRLSLRIRYTTSIGLQASDQRADGTTRTTDMRTHHLMLGLHNDIPLAPGERPTRLILELGWQFRFLDAEIPISIPTYTLSGIYARVGLWFTIGESPISLGIIPEIGHAMSLSSSLSQMAMVNDGFIVGAEAHVRLQIIREVALSLLYRESHAFLSSSRDGGGQVADAERYVILHVEYRF